MRQLFFLLLGFLLIAYACQTNMELTASDKEAMVQSVEQTSKEYWSLLKQSYDSTTFNKVAKFGDENADRMWQTDPVAVIFNTSITKTQAEWMMNLKSMIDNRISSGPEILESYYSVLSKDKVLEVLEADYIITHKDSTVSDPYRMVNTAIWSNIDGVWKVQFWHSSYVKKSE